MALTDGVGKAYISKLIPHEISASAFGIYQTLNGVSAPFASTLAGALWTYAGVRSLLLFWRSFGTGGSLPVYSTDKKELRFPNH
jgi:MFS family permease